MAKVGRPKFTAEQKEASRKANIAKSNATTKARIARTHTESLAIDVKVRGKRNKEIRDADLRLRLNGNRTVDRINAIADEFTLLDQQIKNAKNTEKHPKKVVNTIHKNTARGQILKTQADILFKKLNKLLPDLKAVETTGTFKPSKPENMPEEQLMDILKGNVEIEELTRLFPQYSDIMKTLEDLDIPDLPN